MEQIPNEKDILFPIRFVFCFFFVSLEKLAILEALKKEK